MRIPLENRAAILSSIVPGISHGTHDFSWDPFKLAFKYDSEGNILSGAPVGIPKRGFRSFFHGFFPDIFEGFLLSPRILPEIPPGIPSFVFYGTRLGIFLGLH